MTKYIIFIVIVFIIVYVTSLIKKNINKEEKENPPIEKRPFVFDAMTELTLYRLLSEIFSDKYYIFPQINYGKLIQLKSGAEKFNRNRFDKKIADFVICDKEKAIAKLVIELDGSSHLSAKKMDRDKDIDIWMEKIKLPILHLKTNNLSREYIKQEVISKLNN